MHLPMPMTADVMLAPDPHPKKTFVEAKELQRVYDVSDIDTLPWPFKHVEEEKGGLKVDLPGVKCLRTKTGTTIVAASCKDGVVMGGDSRSTMGNIIGDKDCEKVHKLTESIYMCGSGTAADLDKVQEWLSTILKLYEINSVLGRRARVIMAATRLANLLYENQGNIEVAPIVGGVDAFGPDLYQVGMHGSKFQMRFVAQGSGSYAATAVLEANYRDGMTLDECRALVATALEAGMLGDNASGNRYYLTTITSSGSHFQGPFVPTAIQQSISSAELVYNFAPQETTVYASKTYGSKKEEVTVGERMVQ